VVKNRREPSANYCFKLLIRFWVGGKFAFAGDANKDREGFRRLQVSEIGSLLSMSARLIREKLIH
jgi:hypothetical protein